MAGLCGKGIWLAHSYDLQRAAEIATSIDGTYLLVKVGHGPHYFPETAREMLQRVHALGFHPLAWVQMTGYYPQDALKAISEALTLGYEAVALFFNTVALTSGQLHPLAEALENAAVPAKRLLLATPPLSYMSDPQVLKVLAPVCQGGWMPLCSGTWGDSAEQIIDREVYQALGDLSLMWGKTPDVCPILSPLYRQQGRKMLPEEFIPWVEGIIRHGVDFFSVYHAVDTEKVLWPLLQSINTPCMETAERIPVIETGAANELELTVAQPVYITTTPSDSVWGIIIRYGLSKQLFWEWNAHLWDSRGLPRDPDYLHEGWRIRVK
ncbi:MAG: hypothetical protein JXA33_28510 [Anaerolineae bacterium]|nr:hypothetical protein [Anaerolineae bacterium]